MAMLGKAVRMSRLVNPESNKMMAITVDHAISRGIAPMTGLHSIQSTIDKIILGRPDAMTMTKGIAEHCMWRHAGEVSILLKASNYSPVAPTKDIIFASVDEAVRMGADAISMGAMTLGDFQGEQFEAIGRFSEECMAKGMPLIGHAYPKGESVPADKRTAALLGAPTLVCIAITYVIAISLGRISGFLVGPIFYVSNGLSSLQLRAFASVVMGGTGNIKGAVLSALFIGVFEALITINFSAYKDIFVFSLLIIALVIRPTGLFKAKIGDKA